MRTLERQRSRPRSRVYSVLAADEGDIRFWGERLNVNESLSLRLATERDALDDLDESPGRPASSALAGERVVAEHAP